MSLWNKLRRRRTTAAAVLVFLTLIVTPYWASPISPIAVRQTPATPEKHVADASFQEFELDHPYLEAVDVLPDGRVVFGTETGLIFELPVGALSPEASQEQRPREIARLSGQSIGIAYDPDADAYWSATFPVGLQRISSDGSVQDINLGLSEPVTFPDDVAIGPDGIIYMTEASTKYTPVTTAPNAPYVLWDFIEGRANGRLIAYDPSTDHADVAIDALAFPSGVTVSPDGTALLIVEVSRNRVVRYELEGTGKGSLSVFADGLPGIPDDVFVGPSGHVWVTLVAPRSGMMEDVVGRHPYLARLISILPWRWQNAMLTPTESGGALLMLDEQGTMQCERRLTQGFPPANGAVLGEELLLGRLGGHEFLLVDPSGCALAE
ncbi:strictosidine synthase family protein [Hyphomonas sp.]|uniref:strictosidine synthase family protein n=1 Tax=Hyphomonas sp. TaxID=87 RepID=UPI00352951D4